MKDTKKYYDYIDKLINDTPDFMLINDDESYVLLDRLVVDLSENAMTWLFKVYLDQNYNILKEDNLTDYIKDKYKDIDLKVRNENGNVFLNKDVIWTKSFLIIEFSICNYCFSCHFLFRQHRYWLQAS